MRIVYLISYFQPKLGYQETFLTREFQKLGHQVSLVTSNYYFPFPDYKNTVYKILGERKRKIGNFLEEGIPVYRLPLFFEFAKSTVIVLKNLGKTLSQIQPDAVFADGVFSLLTFQAAYYKKIIGYQLFYDNHASTFNTNLYNTFPKKIYMFFFKNFLIPYIKKNADGFTAIGQSEKWLLCKEYNLKKNKVKLIPLGADTSIFYPDKTKRNMMRKRLEVEENEVLLVYAGKVTKNKDMNILFRAMPLISQKFNNVKLLIISGGEKNLIENLKSFVKKNNFYKKIIWQEPVENKLLADFYNASDVGVWPGDLSNTIIEAMACGLPVILPKVISRGQTSNHLLKNKNGMAFSRGNELDLAKKTSILIRDKKLRKIMGEKSEELVKSVFSWSLIAKRFLRMYEKN